MDGGRGLTKLRIIARLWSHITDLRMIARGGGYKTLKEIEEELGQTEYYIRLYADISGMDDTR